jgi:hypothetical protein
MPSLEQRCLKEAQMTKNAARLLPAALTLALALSSAACLEKDTASTVYVEDDGSATWTIRETDVRSDSDDPEKARQEEEDYLAGYRSYSAPVPVALAAIGGREVRIRILREIAPMAAEASASFPGLEDLARGYCDAAGWPCHTETRREGRLTTWTWTLEPDADAKESSPVDALDAALTGLRIVFVSAHPVSACGFRLEGRTATLEEPKGQENGQPLTLSLTWEGARK